jgi:hypothetical protein
MCGRIESPSIHFLFSGPFFSMPTVAWFYGIAIAMYSPHFHAQYGRPRAVVSFDGRIVAGSLPPTAARLVAQWAMAHQDELVENWTRARADQPLERIAGLDDT